jgi:hypothetical protein
MGIILLCKLFPIIVLPVFKMVSSLSDMLLYMSLGFPVKHNDIPKTCSHFTVHN